MCRCLLIPNIHCSPHRSPGAPTGFMLNECQKSCPKACQRDDKPQVLASALVRDAWAQEDLGLARGYHTALHVSALVPNACYV